MIAKQFFRRYQRWSNIHRQAVGLPLYLGEVILNSVALAVLALAAGANREQALYAAAICAVKLGCDIAAVSPRAHRSLPPASRLHAHPAERRASFHRLAFLRLVFRHRRLARQLLGRAPGTRLELPEYTQVAQALS